LENGYLKLDTKLEISHYITALIRGFGEQEMAGKGKVNFTL
jgi:hypothetical protein